MKIARHLDKSVDMNFKKQTTGKLVHSIEEALAEDELADILTGNLVCKLINATEKCQ